MPVTQMTGRSERFNQYAFYGAVGLVFLLFATVIVQILTRNLGVYLQGTIEAVQILIVWIAFLGLPLIEQTDGHIRVRYVYTRVSPSDTVARRLDWLDDAVTLLSLVGICVSAVLANVQFGTMTTSQLRLPVVLIYAPLAIGSGLAIIHTLRTVAQ